MSIVRSRINGGNSTASTPVTLLASSGVITPNATLGSGPHRHTATADVTLAPPTGGVDGQSITVAITASGGDRVVSFTGGTPPPVTIPNGGVWIADLLYDQTIDKWWLRDSSGGGSGSDGIPTSTVTAKGDLIGGTGNATVARIAGGTADGQLLTRDASAATGMSWSSGGATPIHAVGNSGTTLTVDASSTSGWIKTITLTGNCAISLTGAASGRASRLELILTQDATGSRTVTWPASVKWAGGVTPTLSTAAGAVDQIALTSYNNGASWSGRLVGSYAAGPVPPLFADDFSTGNLSKWTNLQWKGRNSSGTSYSGTGEYSCQIMSDGNRASIARFELRDGDIPPFGGDERTEIAQPANTDIVPNDERWISFDFKLDSTFPTPVDWGPVLMQMHGLPSNGTPAVEFFADPDGNIYINNGSTGATNQVSTIAALKGAWHRVTIHVKFSSSSATGFWEVFLDGVKVVNQTARATMISGDTSGYLKLGLYRSAANTATMISSVDNVRFSNTAPADRRNLLRNPTMELDATDWIGGNAGGTLTICNWSVAFTGAQQPGYVYTSPTVTGGVEIEHATTVDVTVGQAYTASAYAAPQVTTNVTANIDWFAGTTLLSTTSGSATSCPGQAWTRVAATGTAPATATKARLRLLYAAVTAGNLARVDGALFEPSSILDTYFDGSMADACWSGTAHDSPSILAVLSS